MAAVIRPGDTVIIGRHQPRFLFELCSCGVECTTPHSAGSCKANDDLIAEWGAKGELADEHWRRLMPGVNFVWMSEPHFKDYQIIAIYQPAPPTPEPPVTQQVARTPFGLPAAAR